MMPAELWEFGTDSQISLAYSRRRRSGPFHGAPYLDGMFVAARGSTRICLAYKTMSHMADFAFVSFLKQVSAAASVGKPR
jgi:hypothetical protein